MTIEVIDEPKYKSGSADNNFNYFKQHFGDGGQEHPTSKHGIKVYHNDQIVFRGLQSLAQFCFQTWWR